MKLLKIEFLKTKHSKILLLFLIAALVIWIPPYFNASKTIDYIATDKLSVSPGNYFFIEGMLSVAWILFPSSLIVSILMLSNIESSNKGIVKMRTLPISFTKMNLNKFAVLTILSAIQVILILLVYSLVATLSTRHLNCDFFADVSLVIKLGLILFLTSIPMISFFWMTANTAKSKVSTLGINLMALLPSVIFINTNAWYLYPFCYPFYFMTNQLADAYRNLTTPDFKLIPFIVAATMFTLICITISNNAIKNQKEFK